MMGSASGWSSHGPSLGVGASMNWSIRVLKSTVLALLAALSSCAGPLPRAGTAGQASPVTEEVRKELLEARETAWRSFVGKDPSVVEGILAPDAGSCPTCSWITRRATASRLRCKHLYSGALREPR